MNKDTVTTKQAVSLIILTFLSSSIVAFPGINAGKDAWIVKIIAVLIALIFTFIYEQLMHIFPKKNLYEILIEVFGKVIGNIVIILYTIYFFILGSLVLRRFGDMVNVVSIPETPMILPVFLMLLVCILIAKYGVEIIGRWSETTMILVAGVLSLIIIFLVKDMRINNLRPVLFNGIKPVLKEIPLAFAFPYGEVVLFTTIFTTIKGKGKSKIYTIGILISGFLGVILYLTTLLVIGETLAKQAYFPILTTVSHINVGKFIQRIDIVAPLLFILGGVIKVSICIIATSKGIAKIFCYKNYDFIVAPVAFMMFNVFIINFKSIFEATKWIDDIFPIYSLPFQVIIPILLYIIALVRKKIASNREDKKVGNDVLEYDS